MIIVTLIIYSTLEVVETDIGRQVGNIIQSKRAVLNPKIKKTLVMALTWLCGLYHYGHDEMGMGRVNKTNFANNQKGTILDSFKNVIRSKALVVLAIACIKEDDARPNG